MRFVCFITPFIRCLLSPHEPALGNIGNCCIAWFQGLWLSGGFRCSSSQEKLRKGMLVKFLP